MPERTDVWKTFLRCFSILRGACRPAENFRPVPCFTSRRMMLATMVAASLATFIGCGGSPTASPSDENVALSSLKAGLEAWLNGKKASDLQAQTPSIIFVDDAWEKGTTLKAYQVQGEPKPDGINIHYTVELTLVGDKRGESKSVVSYVVGTNPVITVGRD